MYFRSHVSFAPGLYLERICICSCLYRRTLRSNIIGSNKQKQSIIERGVVPRLIALLGDPNSSPSLKIVVAYTLGSIAKGLDRHLKALIENGLVPVLIRGNSDAINTGSFAIICRNCRSEWRQKVRGGVPLLPEDDLPVSGGPARDHLRRAADRAPHDQPDAALHQQPGLRGLYLRQRVQDPRAPRLPVQPRHHPGPKCPPPLLAPQRPTTGAPLPRHSPRHPR